MKRFAILLGTLGIMSFLVSGNPGAQSKLFSTGEIAAPAAASFGVETDFGKMPLHFIRNQGQIDGRVAYYVQGKDKSLYFSAEGITLTMTRAPQRKAEFPSPARGGRSFEAPEREFMGPPSPSPAIVEAEPGRWTVKLDFIGADPGAGPVGLEETGAVISYFKGRPEDWRTGLPTCSKVIYRGLWPGIDLLYYGTVGRLKYEFIVHPGADPSAIRLAYRGAEKVAVDEDGRLQVTTPLGGFSDDVPVAFQEIEGGRRAVSLAYKLDVSADTGGPGESAPLGTAGKAHLYGFEVGDYDRRLDLVLDPAVLVYCGFIGGNGTDNIRGLALDAAGNVYVTGETDSVPGTLPVTAGPDPTYNGGILDAFVAKVDPSGTSLVYCGYLGGADDDRGYGIAVDGSEDVYLTGYTNSKPPSFPASVGPDISHGGLYDAFVAKIDSTGTWILYCGYIGGSDQEGGYAIAVDGSGSAYVTGNGYTNNGTFPAVVGPDLSHNGGEDAFVAKVNPAGDAFDYCGFIGGSSSDCGLGITVDGTGSAYVTGYTGSYTGFPVAVGPDLTHNGYDDVFVAKVDPSGAALVHCGYIGGTAADKGFGIALDRAGSIYVAGVTLSPESSFPVTVGPDLVKDHNYDTFVTKIRADGKSLVYCGYIGGFFDDFGYGIAVDGSGNAYVTGATQSNQTTFPVAGGPDLTFNGGADIFLVKVQASGVSLSSSGYIGGSSYEAGSAVAVDKWGDAYVAATALSDESTFPVLAGPDLSYNGGYDGVVAKVYYYEQRVQKHAAGDFDGDGADEIAMDLGAAGAWMWNAGAWTQLTGINPENLVPADADGDADDEIFLDLGGAGLWLWNGGALNQVSGVNVDSLAAGDTDADGSAEVAADFGAAGLWLWNGGA